jgi:ELWxxDGT repeat protein
MTQATGHELDRTDGTQATPTLVKDIFPGKGSSSIEQLIAYNGQLWFSANDGFTRAELWTSDGTGAGTHLAKDIFPSAQSSSPEAPTGMGGLVYFVAQAPGSGRKLWRTDGTQAGTQLFFDPQQGSSAGFLAKNNRFLVNGNSLYMVAETTATGREPYQTDGSLITPLADTEPGYLGSSPDSLTPLAPTEVLFFAEEHSHGRELWKINVTTNSSTPDSLFSVDGQFALFSASESSVQKNLYHWDKTNGATLLKDIWHFGSIYSAPLHSSPTRSSGAASRPYSRPSPRRALWVTDGTVAGAKQLHVNDPSELFFHPTQKMLYFQSDDTYFAGAKLWRSDGTVPGAYLFLDTSPGHGLGGWPYNGEPRCLAAFGDKLVFSANESLT